MKLETIYAKDVNRPIEGVIKADDDASLKMEVEEYVLTNEISRRLNSFLDAYNHYNNANGVWISGFFGSGKSHLLKILSLLMENKSIEGHSALDLFIEKVDDAHLKGELKKAASLPSKSILFNIDQKADVISKSEVDALLSVFVKVFDEMSGYYGKRSHIAQFERDLDAEDKFDAFKTKYEEISGKEWARGREQALSQKSNIAQAYSSVMGGDPSEYTDIIGDYRKEHTLSIEDFADQVWEYIQKQEKNFRLNFFVDEVGQYIAENVKLMTNLQTIAESLATKCRGQAWVIVTAQEDMSDVVGDMDQKQGNDFSKIQARFANKMKLNSQDVAEVIQRRLLSKNDDASEKLDVIYDKHVNNFKTMFDFSDGSQQYRNFKDKQHFIYSYPFIPYQFTLFQSAIQNLSKHNAFEGRHSSVGERSMLGVFQEVAKKMNNQSLGSLATFDLMFEGIKNTLKASIQQSILKAENNLSSEYAIKVLKALFLVKYVKEFKPSLRNICVLMHEDIDADVTKLKANVEEALNLLEQQTYVQRNGNLFEFLTDEEKDVEQEIKHTDIEPGSEGAELGALVFDTILGDRKIRYGDTGQSYPFARKLDESLQGNRDYELSINVVSPFYEHAGNEAILRGHNMGKDELMIIMEANDRLLRDLSMYLKTEKYIRQNTINAQQDTKKRILQEKREQNNQRKQDILLATRNLVQKATLIANGKDLSVSASDPKSYIISGFQELITMTYPQLKMLKGINYRDEDIAKCLNPDDSLFSEDTTSLEESEQEVLSFIASQSKMGVRTTVKSICDHFEKKPYGWYLTAILCNLAKLNTRGKIECQADSNIIDGSELLSGLKNTHAHANLVLKPQQEYTPSQIRRLKDFYEDFFDVPPSSSEPKSLGLEVAEELQKLAQNLKVMAAERHEFPFLAKLDDAVSEISAYISKPYGFYIEELGKFETPLLELKEKTLSPIQTFMQGEKKKIYEDITTFLRVHEHDLSYLAGTGSKDLAELIEAEDCYKGNALKKAKDIYEALAKQLEDHIKDIRKSSKEAVAALKQKFGDIEEVQKLDKGLMDELLAEIDRVMNEFNRQSTITVIEGSLRSFEDVGFPALIGRATKLAAPPAEDGKPETETKVISARRIKVDSKKSLLSSEGDVDEYLNDYKSALMTEIKSGKKVQV